MPGLNALPLHTEIKRRDRVAFGPGIRANLPGRNKYQRYGVSGPRAPFRAGRFATVAAVLETSDFFQEQIKQCRSLAARATDKNDREFWLRLAHRWEALLRAQQHDGTSVEVQNLGFKRPTTKRRRAA